MYLRWMFVSVQEISLFHAAQSNLSLSCLKVKLSMFVSVTVVWAWPVTGVNSLLMLSITA